MDNTDRRRSPRVPVDRRRDLPSGLRDVSLGGFSLELDEMLPIGTVRDFELKAGRRSRMALRARVRHATPERTASGRQVFVTGLEFLADVTRVASLGRTA